jgi:hypothetical protein
MSIIIGWKDRKDRKLVTLEQDILARKKVRSSTGHPTSRIFVETTPLPRGHRETHCRLPSFHASA